ncbi:Zinc finger and BTB domain-containing protein 40 [Bagarius yarrelli]|uniref:Zinc finger and BTB domain-containing protein 40 n=1 Tax=Bagarius yarrelli TaxID=175774 RepID=A0A556V9D2_BAGYA|nr:Zinc finger and BTB domain-containing protein 40 [Bagarius yarrelli]
MLLRGFEGDPDIDVVFQRLLDQVKDGCELTVQAVVLLLNQIKSLKADLGSVEVQEKEQTETDHKSKRTDDRIGVSLLRTYRNRLCALNLEAQLIRRSLEEGPSIPSDQREVLLKEVDGNMEKLLGAAVNGGLVHPLTVWRLLFWAATHSPELHPIMQEIRAKPDAQELMHMVGRVDALFKHKKLILETLNKIPEPDSDSGNDITVFLHSCHTADGGTESMQQVLERVLGRELQHVRPLCHLLSASHASFPQLSVLIQELGRVMAHNEEIAASEEEEKEKKKEDRTHRRRKGVVVSYSCQWCNKTFDFKCRLLKHKKQCMFSPDRVQRCTECSATFPSITALQQHRAEVHDGPPVKKKKVEPVTCELCGKTFKHPSGLLYHKRTEHLEERPYECEECGVKFAANSSLKNHMRLHTGEKPYHCKHCDMSFAVAAALSYHTKKKHAEDIADPHDCQKCRVSLGSLEKLREHILEVHPKEMHQCPECNKILNTAAQLDKHMSVHDGSKPYSCQSCHKSYQTLSGLWYHNRTTHPDVMTTEGSRSNSHLIHCKICDKSFCNRSSLFKHNITKHSETLVWKCVYCPLALSSEQELQKHVSSDHLSQQGSVIACTVEFQQHFLTDHVQLVQEGEFRDQDPPSQMVIQTEEASNEETAQIVGLDQTRLAGSQQVFVALGDSGETASDSGIVAVNMEDLLTGRVRLICEESQ